MTQQRETIRLGVATVAAATLVATLMATVLATMFAGCGGDLPAASRLERTRVLGARVQVADDPGRAEARAGEAAVVEWLLAGPRAPGSLAWSFSMCTAINGACEGAPTMTGQGTTPPIVVPFLMPAAIDDVRRPMLLGAICEGGAPAVDSQGLPICGAGTTSANPARFQLPRTTADQAANRHPQLADDAIEFDGVAWTARAIGDAGIPCDGSAGMPLVAPGDTEHRLRVVTDGNDRDSFTPDGANVPQLEELQLSSFATEGEVLNQYATVDAMQTDLTGKWTAPAAKAVPAAGLTVNFHFVLRDGRGGLDWTDRALCVRLP